MRTPVILLQALLCTTLHAQHPTEQILRINPYEANGYFVVDSTRWAQAGATSLEVEIRALNYGQTHPGVLVETFTLTDPNGWQQADGDLVLGAYEEYDLVYYSMTLRGANNNILLEFVGLDNEGPLPVGCHQLCNGTDYGWRLTAYHDGYVTTNIGINDPGLYFYVPATDWGAFTLSHSPQLYGLPEWPNAYTANDAWVIYVSEAPPQAVGHTGGPCGCAGEPAYAIRKDKGTWRELWAGANNMQWNSAHCDDNGQDLHQFYNAHQDIDDQLTLLGLPGPPLPALACPGGVLSPMTFSPPTGMDPDGCTWEVLEGNQAVLNADGSYSLVEYVAYYTDCGQGSTTILGDFNSISMVPWSAANTGPVIHVPIPDPGEGTLDPRLIPMQRTYVNPGLYDIMMVMRDGTIRHRFENITEPITMAACFADFVHINIYPVPVIEQVFSIDMEIFAPLAVNVLIVNNQGTPYYTNSLDLTEPGLHKHVVNMNGQWPSGIYHAVFQYADYSSEAKHFTVE